MGPVTATRAGRSLLAGATIVSLALIIAAPAGAAAAPVRPHAQAADACAGDISLGLSDRHPRQMHPVRFGVVSSTLPAGSVVFFDFSYGDGSDDAGAQPTAVHAYQEPGDYLAKVSVVTTCNTVVSSPEYHVVVADGLPPTVTIGYPRASQIVHFGRAGLLLDGTARDPSGVRRVELAIQLLSLKIKRSAPRAAGARAAKAKKPAVAQPGCYWYDGHLTLKVRGCATPLFFRARLSGSRWSFRMNPRSAIPPGVYAVRARATDRVGNVTTIFSEKLGDILPFGLVA